MKVHKLLRGKEDPYLYQAVSIVGSGSSAASNRTEEVAADQSVEISESLGTVWTCIDHIITAVIGSGVLSLAWSSAQLGWIMGPVSMLCFAIVTYITASLLSDCYRSPHPVTGIRNYSYMDAVRVNLGEKQTWVCGLIQYASMCGTGIAYSITTPASMRTIQRSNCYHEEGHGADCSYGITSFTLLFGAAQIVLSQMPDFPSMKWLSVVAAIMSFCYSSVGLGLGFAKVIGNGRIKGGIRGVRRASSAQKVWTVSQALGDIAFSYPFSLILLEIQRCGKSCRLRWTNYLRPDLKHGEFTDSEEHTIVKLHCVVGNRWSLITAQLPGRTDNDVKNHWNTKLKKKISGMGIDPVTHKPFSHLMAEIATALPPPQVAHLAEAALGCFKDEMLDLLTKKRVKFSLAGNNNADASGVGLHHMTIPMDDDKEDMIQKIKRGLSRAIMNEETSDGLGAMCDDMFQNLGEGFRFDGERPTAWSTCMGGGGAAVQQSGIALHEKIGGDNGEDQSNCVLWDLSNELMHLN